MKHYFYALCKKCGKYYVRIFSDRGERNYFCRNEGLPLTRRESIKILGGIDMLDYYLISIEKEGLDSLTIEVDE